MIQDMLDGAGYVPGDYALAVLITLAACVTYARIAFEIVPTLRVPAPRLLMALGWTILALRFWLTLAMGGDVIVAPVSLVALGMITSGYCLVQIRAIRRALALARDPLYCLQAPEQRCQREDRVAEVMKK